MPLCPWTWHHAIVPSLPTQTRGHFMYAASLTPCTQPHNSAACRVLTQRGQGNIRIPPMGKYNPTEAGHTGAASANNTYSPQQPGGCACTRALDVYRCGTKAKQMALNRGLNIARGTRLPPTEPDCLPRVSNSTPRPRKGLNLPSVLGPTPTGQGASPSLSDLATLTLVATKTAPVPLAFLDNYPAYRW